MASRTAPPHIVVVPLPIYGHINPLLRLSVQLASAGFHVTFITTTSTKQAAGTAMREAMRYDLQERIKLQALDDGSGIRYGLVDSIQFVASKAGEIGKLVEHSISDGFGALSFSILDFLLLEPLNDVAFLQAVPSAAYFVASAAMLHLSLSVDTLLERGYLPPKVGSQQTVVDSSLIPGLPTDLKLCVFTDLPEDPIDPSYKSMSQLKHWLLKASSLLMNTFEPLEKDSLVAIQQLGFNNLVTIGPLLDLQPHSITSDPILEWLDKRAPSSVLYISFGTMAELAPEQLEEIAYGLEASEQAFVWVIRESSRQVLGDRIQEILQGGRGLVVSWAPQLDVLKHPSVGGFLTHCGWNSVLEALSCGIPMLGWPFMGDQIVNSKYISDVWKVGLRLPTKDVTKNINRLAPRDEIEAGCRSLMSSKQIKQRAREVSEQATQAAQMSQSKLEKLVKGIMLN